MAMQAARKCMELQKGDDKTIDMDVVTNLPEQALRNLIPAAQAIQALGMMMCLSNAMKDFELVPGDNKRSFRATLMQASNCGTNAFQIAHKVMQNISLKVTHVPRLMTGIMNLLINRENAPAQQVSELIKVEVKALTKIGDGSLESATNAYNGFQKLQDLLQETTEVLTATKGHAEGEEATAASEMQETEMMKETLESLRLRSDQHLKKLKYSSRT